MTSHLAPMDTRLLRQNDDASGWAYDRIRNHGPRWRKHRDRLPVTTSNREDSRKPISARERAESADSVSTAAKRRMLLSCITEKPRPSTVSYSRSRQLYSPVRALGDIKLIKFDERDAAREVQGLPTLVKQTEVGRTTGEGHRRAAGTEASSARSLSRDHKRRNRNPERSSRAAEDVPSRAAQLDAMRTTVTVPTDFLDVFRMIPKKSDIIEALLRKNNDPEIDRVAVPDPSLGDGAEKHALPRSPILQHHPSVRKRAKTDSLSRKGSSRSLRDCILHQKLATVKEDVGQPEAQQVAKSTGQLDEVQRTRRTRTQSGKVVNDNVMPQRPATSTPGWFRRSSYHIDKANQVEKGLKDLAENILTTEDDDEGEDGGNAAADDDDDDDDDIEKYRSQSACGSAEVVGKETKVKTKRAVWINRSAEFARFAAGSTAWRTIPMQGPLEQHLYWMYSDKGRNFSFSKHVGAILPGQARRGGPISRPRSHKGKQRK